MATQLSVWSAAFTRLAGGGLRSLEDRRAETIRQIYPSLKAGCLSTHEWPWTVRRRVLSRDADYEQGDRPFLHRYPFPADILGPGPLAVYDYPGAESPTERTWANESGAVLSNAEQVEIRYQFDAPEETWPEQFALWVTLLIVAELRGTYGDPAEKEGDYRRADEQLARVGGATGQVIPPQRLFSHFATTTDRTAGWTYDPLSSIGRQ